MNLSHLNQSFSKIIDEIPHSKQEVCFSSVAGGSSSFFISLIHQRVNSPLLVVVDSFESGEKLLHDIEFFRGKGKVDFFPHWDIMPYDNLSPDKSVIANRLATLSNLLLKKSNIVITTPNALIQKIMPVSAFLNYTFTLKIGEVYPREELIRKLCNIGYIRVDTVEEIGEFSIRGEIVDIFPLGKVQPIRLDFFDDDLETMRFFEVDSQRSKLEVDNVLVLPSHEIIFDEQSVQLAVKQVAQKKGTLSRQLFEVYEEQIQTGVPFPGVENFIPLYFKECSTLFDYFQDNPLIIFEDREQVRLRSNDYFHEIASEYELSKQQDNLTLDVSELYLDPTQLQAQFSKYKTVNFQTQGIEDTAVTTILPVLSNEGLHSISISSENKNQNPIKNVINQLIQWHKEGALVAIAARNQSEAEKVRHMMMELDYSAEIEKEVSYEDRTRFLLGTSHKKQENIIIFEDFISSGFRFVNEVGESKVIFVSDEEIFGPRRKQRRVKRSSLKQFLSSLGSLNVGDYVVHVEYGIGQYEGLKKIEIQDTSTDYLVLSYLGGDKVYVPVEKFHLVQKFSGLDTKRPRLNKLGEKTWKKTKSKVRTEIMDMADDLVKIYAQRSAQQGVSFSKDSTMMDEFALTFPYQETDDQEQAIHEVISDMESTNPMDRLVCGDVGFGKTEVAMRAACKAAIDSYQVGILVPTTILAQQHYESFCERFKNFPINTTLLSRFQTAKEIKERLKEVKEGKIDIVIGTHRLLSKDVSFKNLGLLVIDEEQRFGVRHKEKIKEFRALVEVLTLSATPIPRTLHMSLMGIKDISVINTPPMDRRAIRTRLMKFSDYIIQEAVNRELRRDGQIFFIHNRVETIYQVAQYLKDILPEVRIGVAHGQMTEKKLEEVMFGFVHHEYDILLATTIVESGLDIPNANTIIVNNSDQFGLSQLYQLRGRVGRSNLQAYAYLLVPKDKVISSVARKRLNVLKELNDLGAGFKIASHDLELRGAGDLLGSKQSGQIASVGFDLYLSMVDTAVRKIQNGEIQIEAETEQEEQDIKISLNFEANLPDEYIESMGQRLDFYKEIASCKTEDDVWETRTSMEERFGKLPEISQNLFYNIQIKLLAEQLEILKLEIKPSRLELTFSDNFQPDPQVLFEFSSEFSGKFLPGNRIHLSQIFDTPTDILNCLHTIKKRFFHNQ